MDRSLLPSFNLQLCFVAVVATACSVTTVAWQRTFPPANGLAPRWNTGRRGGGCHGTRMNRSPLFTQPNTGPPDHTGSQRHSYQHKIADSIAYDGPFSTITVSYEGQSCAVTVRPDESILEALERQMQYLKAHLSSLPDLPSDCRRGNCLTCVASCTPVSNESGSDQPPVFLTHDGLSPAMSRLVADKGYILTCSSYMTAPSGRTTTVSLQLGEHHAVWKEVYASPGRFTTSQAQLESRSAVARVLRQSAERNIEEWTRETEQILQKTTHEGTQTN